MAGQHAQDWTREGTLTLPRARYLRGTGPRSLAAMSARIVADNIGAISEAMLDPLTTPRAVIWRIYQDLAPRGLTFHAWKLLSKLLVVPHSNTPPPTPLLHFTTTLTNPQHDLHIYTTPLTSPTSHFLARLKIDRIAHIQPNDLLTLTDLPNLSLLDLTEAHPSSPDESAGRVTDNLARGWSEKPHAFPALQTLRLWGCKALSHRSLRYMAVFPTLVVYSASGPEQQWALAAGVTRKLGWEEVDGEPDSVPSEEGGGSATTTVVPTASLELVPAPGQLAERSRVAYASWPKRCFSRELVRGQGPGSVKSGSDYKSHDSEPSAGPSRRKRQQSGHQTGLRPKKRQNVQDVFSGFGM